VEGPCRSNLLTVPKFYAPDYKKIPPASLCQREEYYPSLEKRPACRQAGVRGDFPVNESHYSGPCFIYMYISSIERLHMARDGKQPKKFFDFFPANKV
jgi:hypothetical protein